ncbi:MAG: hypothetical protein CUN50_00915 [Candidatus Thermofonsia Clade 1 bacterium]|uniref:Peptidase C39-like domain-containing protein n=1 Tax=Candidatus Thermofonsia Clade 1 bacterium TaxID=2364210 RepID=A0A2M8Q0F0_9CHLR|nr:MAG: hypothetical protein CUN50_00915 [Candidatus Thermofonsia Clade 1 bacterium]
MSDQMIAEAPYRRAPYVAPPRLLWLKLGLGCLGLSMILFTSIAFLVLIVTPIWFRSLPTSEQVIWMNRVPLLEAFKPTRAYSADALPTAANRNDDALALLATVPASPTAELGGALQAGGNAENIASAPTRRLPNTPSRGPTSVLVTNTPVIAARAATPTPFPTLPLVTLPTATTTPTLPPSPVPTEVPIPVAWQGQGFRFVQQTWNTCGPANLTQVLYYMGLNIAKDEVTRYLKPSTEDRNVSPWEMVNYVNEHLNKERGIPLKALMRVGGDLSLIKRLVANGFGVILEKGYFVAGEGWMGHYLTIQGYDDARSEFHVLDTYRGARWESYRDIDERWQQFNRLYIVVYPAERERELAILLGAHQDVTYSIQYALSRAKEEASLQPDNPFAWFNMGSSYVLLRDYRNAVRAFDRARSVGSGLPWRMLWYQFTMYEAYYYAGQYNEVIALADATLGTSSDLEESHYWRGMALAAQGNFEEAQRAFRRVLSINPRYTPAQDRLEEIRTGRFRPPSP